MEQRIAQTIEGELQAIERTENVTILLAIESGSRAWGFASPNSDYDVRFLYLRPRDHYLRLDQARDVIEWRLDDTLDINGWDYSKTLRLLRASNPTLFEWVSSPIVYRRHPFMDEFVAMARTYFVSKPSLHHYLRMAQHNYSEFLQGERVKLKKYFYVLRPILACRHIFAEGTPPPMLFETLASMYLDAETRPHVDALLAQKMAAPELGEGPRVPVLNAYIERSLAELTARVYALPSVARKEWEELNALFLRALTLV